MAIILAFIAVIYLFALSTIYNVSSLVVPFDSSQIRSVRHLLEENKFSAIMKVGTIYCRVKSVGIASDVYDEVLHSVAVRNYITTERFVYLNLTESKDADFHKKQLAKHSSFCVNVLVMPGSSLHSFLKSIIAVSTGRLEMVHFIFFGSQDTLTRIWGEKLVQSIKIKTGIPLDSPGFLMTQRDTRTFDSSDVKIVKGIPQSDFSWSSFRNQRLAVGVVDIEPYVTRDANHKPIFGMMYKPLEFISGTYNVTLDFKYSLKGVRKFPNGTWEGFAGELVEKTLDMYFCESHLYLRFEIMDYSNIIYEASTRIYIPHPKVRVKWQAILYPFDYTVWVVILGILIGLMPLFWIHLAVKRDDAPSPTDIVYKSVVLPYMALLQGSAGIPRRVRLLTVTTLFYSMIIGVFFGCNLVSFLTFPEPEAVPGNFEELAARQDYAIHNMYYKGGGADYFFKQTTIPTYVEIRRRMIEETDFGKCVRSALFEAKTVCIGWPLVAETIMAKNFTLHASFIPLRPTPPAFTTPISVALQKNSKHFESFNSAITWLIATGQFSNSYHSLLAYMQKNGREWLMSSQGSTMYQKLTSLSETLQVSATRPFGLENFAPGFITVFVGAFLAGCSWIVEMMVRSMVSGFQ